MFGIDSSAEDKPISRKSGRSQKDGKNQGEKKNFGGLANKRMEAQMQKNKETQKMIHSYRDRLLPRFAAN